MKVSDTPFDCVNPYLRGGLDVFIGAEALIAEGLRHGAVGAVSGVAAAFPEALTALIGDPTPERSALVQSLRHEMIPASLHCETSKPVSREALLT